MENEKLGQVPSYPIQTNQAYLPGMSKRFYAACAAMQGLCSDPNVALCEKGCKIVAKLAYRVADELLKQENE